MKTVLFCWELGMGNGHVGPFERLGRRFIQDGWRVAVIARDLSRVARFFKPTEVAAWQAPFKIDRAVPHIPNPITFAEMFLNLGYRHENELRQLILAWRLLFQQIKPDLMIFDHSPTALLASRGLNVPRMTIGTGFCIPRDVEPLENIRLDHQAPASERLVVEHEILIRINSILKTQGQPELPRVAALYSEVTRHLLTTFEELDHFGPRHDATYFGAWGISEEAALAAPPPWPAGRGPKVYAYLKRMPGLKELLQWLTHRGVPVIVVFDGVTPADFQQFVGSNIHLCDSPISLNQVVAECDVALTNAGHGTTCQLLLSGVCHMMIPLTLEQVLLSERVKALKAGLDSRRHQLQLTIRHLETLLDCPDPFGGAVAFQIRYKDWSEAVAIENAYTALTEYSG